MTLAVLAYLVITGRRDKLPPRSREDLVARQFIEPSRTKGRVPPEHTGVACEQGAFTSPKPFSSVEKQSRGALSARGVWDMEELAGRGGMVASGAGYSAVTTAAGGAPSEVKLSDVRN